jgi:hypothetical protein
MPGRETCRPKRPGMTAHAKGYDDGGQYDSSSASRFSISLAISLGKLPRVEPSRKKVATPQGFPESSTRVMSNCELSNRTSCPGCQSFRCRNGCLPM